MCASLCAHQMHWVSVQELSAWLLLLKGLSEARPRGWRGRPGGPTLHLGLSHKRAHLWLIALMFLKQHSWVASISVMLKGGLCFTQSTKNIFQTSPETRSFSLEKANTLLWPLPLTGQCSSTFYPVSPLCPHTSQDKQWSHRVITPSAHWAGRSSPLPCGYAKVCVKPCLSSVSTLIITVVLLADYYLYLRNASANLMRQFTTGCLVCVCLFYYPPSASQQPLLITAISSTQCVLAQTCVAIDILGAGSRLH